MPLLRELEIVFEKEEGHLKELPRDIHATEDEETAEERAALIFHQARRHVPELQDTGPSNIAAALAFLLTILPPESSLLAGSKHAEVMQAVTFPCVG